jgi:hypothetical protein
MSSSTSGHTSSDPVVATDAERLRPAYRDAVYGRGLLLLWIGVLGGPLVWLLDLQVAYWLVYRACHTNSMMLLYMETLLAVVLGAVPVMIAWRMLQRFPEADRTGGQPDDRARFMALAGIGLAVLFFATVLASAVPRFVLTPCP